MKKKNFRQIQIQLLIYLIITIKPQKTEIENFECKIKEKSLSIDLNKKNEKKFSISFWLKISKKKPQTLFSFENLIKQITIEINRKNEITLNKKRSDIKILTNSKQKKNKWNFFLIYLNFQNPNKIILNFSINQIEFQKSQKFITKQNFFLILGSNQKYSNCKTNLFFHNLKFYFFSQKFNNTIQISLEAAKPIFMSKFNKEPSYNKFYENILNNSYGPISNGFKKNCFNLFTNVSTSNNKLGIKYHLINDLSVFLLPKFLLDNKKINQSYIFIIQFDFFIKNYLEIKNLNQYYHVLYQRYSKNDNKILIRSDVKIFFDKENNFFEQRNFLGKKKKCFDKKNLEMIKNDNSLEKINELDFLLIKVFENPLFEKPVIEFKNGLNKNNNKKNIFEIDLKLNSNDKHFFGDSEKRDSTRKEFLSFINIKEVSFYRGAYIQEKKFSSNELIFFSGYEKLEYLLYCSKTNDLDRGDSKNLILNKCEKNKIICDIKNCDICDNNKKCIICKPGFELINEKNNKCRKCKIEEGYDPILKKCFKGTAVNEFFETQYSNLNSSLLDIDTLNLYFIVTAKLKIIPDNFLNNGFLFFLNDIQDYNRITDVCWDNCEDRDFEIYYGLQNKNIDLKINKLILGNTSNYSIVPETFIFKIRKPSDFTSKTKKYKNFDCSFINKILLLPKNNYFGTCVSKCPKNTYLDHDINRCLNCKTNCLNCSKPENCLQCKKGYTLIKNKCEKCQYPCKTCKTTVNTCLSCLNKNKLNIKNNNCDNNCILKNCRVCDLDNNCLNCEKGFLLEQNKCKKIFCKIDHCEKCENISSCFICEKGFVLENRKCRVCKKNCSECPDGWYLDKFMKCVKKKKIGKFLETVSKKEVVYKGVGRFFSGFVFFFLFF